MDIFTDLFICLVNQVLPQVAAITFISDNILSGDFCSGDFNKLGAFQILL